MEQGQVLVTRATLNNETKFKGHDTPPDTLFWLLPPTSVPRGIPNKNLHYIPPIASGITISDATSPSLRRASLTPVTIALHTALSAFRPVDANYTVRSYSEAFNWNEISLPLEMEGHWFAVAFRSKRSPDADGSLLYEADRKSAIEAVKSGGLLMYWYGVPSPTGECLATCIWTDREAARRANSRPDHSRAARLARSMYVSYDLERYRVIKNSGHSGLYIEPWGN